jgi:general secretion pathway protein J
MKPVPTRHWIRRSGRAQAGGFTLIEVLVALLIMAILATLAWQGLDGILRARDGNRNAIDSTVRLATVMTQWEQDLGAIVDTGALSSPLAFDGQSLRLTRRTDRGVMLVVWAVRNGVWQRWTSQPLVRSAALQDVWTRSATFQGQEAGQLTVATGASQWQVYFNWGGQWSNAQSTGNQEQVVVASPAPAAPPVSASAPASAASGAEAAASAPAAAPTLATRATLPDAVRLQITLDGRRLVRDIPLGAGG